MSAIVPRAARKMPSSVWRPLAVVCLACVAALLFGYTLGFTSPALLPMELSAASAVFATETVSDGVISSSDASSFGALANIGAMVGALLAGPLSDGVGRKSAIAICAVLWVVGWFSLGASSSASEVLGPSMGVWAIFGARLLTGVGLGIASGTVPVYIAEISPAAIRGSLGVLNQLGIVSGIFLVYAIGYARQRPERSTVSCLVSPIGDEAGPAGCQRIASSGWACVPDLDPSGTDAAAPLTDPHPGQCVGQMARWVELTSVAGAVAAWLLVGAWFLLPESPVYLRSRGRAAEALEVETWLNGGRPPVGSPQHGKPPPSEAQNGQNGQNGQAKPMAPSELSLCSPSVRAPLRISISLMAIQQFSGVNAVIFYSSDILLRAGVADPNLGGLMCARGDARTGGLWHTRALESVDWLICRALPHTVAVAPGGWVFPFLAPNHNASSEPRACTGSWRSKSP